MSDGNKNRDHRVFETLYHRLLGHYGKLLAAYGGARVIEEIKGKSIKLIESTTIALCLALFDWAKFRTAKAGSRYTPVGTMR